MAVLPLIRHGFLELNIQTTKPLKTCELLPKDTRDGIPPASDQWAACPE